MDRNEFDPNFSLSKRRLEFLQELLNMQKPIFISKDDYYDLFADLYIMLEMNIPDVDIIVKLDLKKVRKLLVLHTVSEILMEDDLRRNRMF